LIRYYGDYPCSYAVIEGTGSVDAIFESIKTVLLD